MFLMYGWGGVSRGGGRAESGMDQGKLKGRDYLHWMNHEACAYFEETSN